MSRGMLLTGAFTEADFAEILETVRAIEQRDTDKLYHATFHEVPGGDSDDQAEGSDKEAEPMTVPELRGILTAIKELGMMGRIDPDAVASRDEQPLLVALGTIAGLATVALEGETLPPQRIEIDEATWTRVSIARLTDGDPVVLQTSLGYRVELHWPRRA